MQHAVAEGLVDQPLLETIPQSASSAVDPWILVGEMLNAYAQLDELFGGVISHLPGGKLNDRELSTRQASHDARDHVLAIVQAHADKCRSIELVNQLKVLLSEMDADPLLAYVCRPLLKRMANALGIQ
ncbi:hypothetical protein [Burkholderia gladioli]|uniref:hypothetical protein n=1 Tax=Burkholderia gladioli TaxID=28095 RepID=UPI00030168C6|nr:hypothetical protein [Burkholderia gladioli]